MKHIIKWLIFTIFMLPLVDVAAANNDLDELQSKINQDWVMVKNDTKHEIQVYMRQEPDKRLRSFKVVAVMEGSLDDFVRMILDIDSYSRWYFLVKESKLLKQLSATEYLIYLVHNSPPAIPDRDVILHLEFEPPTTARPYLIGRQKALPKYMADRPNHVRVMAEDLTVNIQRWSENRLRVEAEGFIDPGGNDPIWAVSFFQRSAPYNTFLSMQRRLKQIGGQDTSPLPFTIDKAAPFTE